MALLGRKRTHGASMVLFDIGTSSVGVMLGVRHKAGHTQPLWHTRRAYGYTTQDNYERYVKDMGAQLLDVCMAVTQEGIRIAKNNPTFNTRDLEVWCVYAPPWFFGGVGTSTKRTERKQAVTHGMLDTMRSKVLEEIESRPAYQAWASVAGAYHLLEQVDLALELDGYRVSTPDDYLAHDIRLTSYLSVVPQNIVDSSTDVLGKTFANHTIHLTTSTRLLARQRVSETTYADDRTLLIEIGGQVTSVTVVEGGVPTGIATFPMGSYHLLRAAAPKSTSLTEAHTACAACVQAYTKKSTAKSDQYDARYMA